MSTPLSSPLSSLAASINATIPSSDSVRTLGELLGIPRTEKKTRGKPVTKPFPLTKVVVTARIVGDCAVTTLEEHYANPHKQPLDVTHTMPLPYGAAVTAFEIIAGDRVAKGLCKRTAEAKNDFANALARGKTAAMIESHRDDVHTISLGNIAVGASVIVRMTLVERLECRNGALEYRFPTTIAKKFVPGEPKSHKGSGTSADTDRAPDASHLSPPIRLEGGTALHFSLHYPTAVCTVQSSVNLVVTEEASETIARLSPDATCSGDVVIRLDSRAADATLRAYSDGERTLVILDPPIQRKRDQECRRIASFMLDRSGSMEGTPLDAAKQAVSAALDELGEHDAFELAAFDGNVERFRPSATAVTRENLRSAKEWLATINARGGTDALPALEAACTTPVQAGWVRTVMFVTDGHVAQDGEILNLTNRMDLATRLFVVGIGMAPSNALLARLARLGGGTYLALPERDGIETAMTRFGHEFSGPIAFALREQGTTESSKRDLFSGKSASFFLQGHRDTVSIESIDGRFSATCDATRAPISLGALWARGVVETLEDSLVANPREEAAILESICALGVAHQIQTRCTSFVAIDETGTVDGEPMQIEQPVDDVGCESIMACMLPTPVSNHASRMAFCAPRATESPARNARSNFSSMGFIRGRPAAPQTPSETSVSFTAPPTGKRTLDWSKAMSPPPSMFHALQILYWGVTTEVDRNGALWQQLVELVTSTIASGTRTDDERKVLKKLVNTLGGSYGDGRIINALEELAQRFPT